jgi:hypothetical protein
VSQWTGVGAAAARLREALSPMQGVTGPSRQAWGAKVYLEDGRQLMLRLTPLPGGATLVGFRPIDEVNADAGETGLTADKAPASDLTASAGRRIN